MDNLPIIHIPNFINNTEYLFDYFLSNLDRKCYKIKMYGKDLLQPRLVSYYGDLKYKYSQTILPATVRDQELNKIKNIINQEFGLELNNVLCNLYRDGSDSMGRHTDDETELDPDPNIISITFGNSRIFKLKNKITKEGYDLNLSDGDLLFMTSGSQINRLHSIPKTNKIIGPRINLTFRKIHG